jgi:RHS repeat-associated protein
LVSDGQRGFEYDDENQLIAVTATNSWRSEFVYDGLGRRRVRVEKVWQNSQWTTSAEVRYVYDHMLVLQERDQNNIPQVSYTRGVDLSGSLQRAGGIGGLLARTEPLAFSLQHSYFHADAVGNITCLVNGQQVVVARYLYDPFGNLLSLSGPLAEANLYRFASKELHPNSGLIYFGFRYYGPNLQRWLNADPLEEEGGINLYLYAGNGPVSGLDPWGLEEAQAQPTYKPKEPPPRPPVEYWGKIKVNGSNPPKVELRGSILVIHDPQIIAAMQRAMDAYEARRARADYVQGVDEGQVRLGDLAVNPEGVLLWAEVKHGVAHDVPIFIIKVGAEYLLLALTPEARLVQVVAQPVSKGKWAATLAARAKQLYAKVKALFAAKGLPPLRQQYVDEVLQLKEVALASRGAGASAEATARLLHAERNALKLKYRELSPADAVKRFEQRNIEKYGNPLGPSIDQLRAAGKSWDDIIESATRPGGGDLGF